MKRVMNYLDKLGVKYLTGSKYDEHVYWVCVNKKPTYLVFQVRTLLCLIEQDNVYKGYYLIGPANDSSDFETYNLKELKKHIAWMIKNEETN